MSSPFEDFVRSHGIIPKGPILPDGKVHRCGTESHPRSSNGAYWLAPTGTAGWCMDWAIHAKGDELWWHPDEDEVDEFDPAKLRRAREAARKRKRQRAVEQREASRAARAYYDQCAPLRGGHPYLEAHGLGLQGCDGVRLDPNGRAWLKWINSRRRAEGKREYPYRAPDHEGWLVIPAGKGRRFLTVQRIAPDGQKKFWTGAPAAGASFRIRSRQRSTAITILAEGFATGLALYVAVPIAQVIVAFNAGNMTHGAVLSRLRRRGMALVAADNDHRTVCQRHQKEGRTEPLHPFEERPDWCQCNPGITAGKAAADELGLRVAYPHDIQGTDWCDWRQERFEDAMKRKNEYTPESTVLANVDGELRAKVMKHARMRHAL